MPTAIITGGGVRLGKAMALHLAKKGYTIALHHNASSKNAEQTIAEIRELGVSCEPFPCDFTDLSATENLIKTITTKFSDIEILINCAANFIQEDIENTSTQSLEDTFHINLLTPFILMREYKSIMLLGQVHPALMTDGSTIFITRLYPLHQKELLISIQKLNGILEPDMTKRKMYNLRYTAMIFLISSAWTSAAFASIVCENLL